MALLDGKVFYLSNFYYLKFRVGIFSVNNLGLRSTEKTERQGRVVDPHREKEEQKRHRKPGNQQKSVSIYITLPSLLTSVFTMPFL